MTPEGGSDRSDGIAALLNRAPEQTWPDAVVHHGARLLLLVGLAALVTGLFPPADRMDVARYEVGTVADETVQAEVPFAVPKTEDELRRDRNEAAAAVPPTFEHRPAAADSMGARLERFFGRLDEAAAEAGPSGVENVLSEVGIAATPDQLTLLADDEARGRIEEAALRVARQIVPRGVVDASQAEEITTDRITVRRQGGEERSIPVDSLLVGREFLDRATAVLGTVSPDLEDLFRLILIRFVEPTFALDVVPTELDKEAARRSVPTTKENVLAGQVIVRAGDPIGESEVERLNAYQEQLRTQGLLEDRGLDLAPLFGAGLLNLLLFSVFGLLLYFFRPEIYGNFRWLLLQAILVSAYFGFGRVVAAQSWPPEVLPVAFVTLAVAVLWDGRLALVLGLLVGVITGLLPPFSEFRILALTLLAGAAGALTVRVIRRRAQTWGFAAVVTTTYAVTILAFALVQGGDLLPTGIDIAWAAGNATASAILAMGFVPVFEWFTGITTDQTLLEWADPNRPLLKKLSMEAPGTYAHTINVANLAEAAANSIGANGLLCRVGVYYHDVGKMLKPQYFVENQPGGRNPHDKLKPDTSASIVREHVLEGLRLARDEGVPEVILDFIAEHHGTQEIGFFYEKAKEEYGEDELDPEQFRYPGPRPRSRETALVMLADSVESATRALQEPTRERTRELIESIVEGKIDAGQLDEAPLTLKEIAALKEQFAKILGGMYHQRIDYPATRHLTESRDDETVAGVEGVEEPIPGGAARETAGAAGSPGPGGERESGGEPEPGAETSSDDGDPDARGTSEG